MSVGYMIPISEQDVRTQSSTQAGGVTLGQLGSIGNKLYRYSKNGAVDLAPGKITVNADVDSNVVDKTVARTYAAGVYEVIIDAAGAITADAYKDGGLTINDGTGEGYTYDVAGNSVTSGAAELTVYLKEPTRAALTIDVSEATLTKNDYDGVLISIADQADFATGVPNAAVTASYYHWEQVGGRCAVLADEAIAKGLALTIGSSTVGAVEALDGAGEPQIGVATMAMVDTEYQPCRLQIA